MENCNFATEESEGDHNLNFDPPPNFPQIRFTAINFAFLTQIFQQENFSDDFSDS